MRRLRRADWVMLVSAIAVLVTLFLDWFTTAEPVPSGSVGYAPLDTGETGWSSLGWPALALILIAVALALAVVALIASGARDAVNLPPADLPRGVRAARADRHADRDAAEAGRSRPASRRAPGSASSRSRR